MPNGSLRFIVVEAKGGNSPLGTRLVNTTVETQGTPEYFEATAESMRARGGDAGRVGSDLLRAFRVGKTSDGKPAEVVYVVVRTPISSQGAAPRVGAATAKQFELTGQHP